jgi:hypothetical protein
MDNTKQKEQVMNEKKVINGLKGIVSTCNWWAFLFGISFVILYYLRPEERKEDAYGIWFIFIPLIFGGLLNAFITGYQRKVD